LPCIICRRTRAPSGWMSTWTAFLASPTVVLVVGADDPDEAIELDCGFWRQWGLFDVRREGNVSADQQSGG
jgi:hypothetical protein